MDRSKGSGIRDGFSSLEEVVDHTDGAMMQAAVVVVRVFVVRDDKQRGGMVWQVEHDVVVEGLEFCRDGCKGIRDNVNFCHDWRKNAMENFIRV